MNRHLKNAIKVSISIILVLIILKRLEVAKIPFVTLKERPFLFLLIPVFTTLTLLCDVFIKRTMFGIFDYHVGLCKLLKELFKGVFYGFFMPSIIGGDVYYIMKFGKDFRSYSRITSGIFLIKSIGFSIFSLFAAIIGAIYWKKIANQFQVHFPIKKIIIPAIIVLLLVLLLITSKRFMKRMCILVEKIKPIKKTILYKRNNLLAIVLYSVIFYIVSVGSRVILAIGIGIKLPFFQLAGIILLVNFLVLLPITISGIGVRESSYVMLLGIFGIKSEQAFLLSILDFMISISGVVIGGILISWDSIMNKLKTVEP